MITLLVVMGAGFGGYKLMTMRMLEYEYSLTNGYVAVDKIMNRSSRKRMTAFECNTAEDIGPYTQNEARLKNQSFDARIFATEYADHRDAWYMVVRSQKTGKTLVVFNPDEELLEGIKKFIPRPLKFEKVWPELIPQKTKKAPGPLPWRLFSCRLLDIPAYARLLPLMMGEIRL